MPSLMRSSNTEAGTNTMKRLSNSIELKITATKPKMPNATDTSGINIDAIRPCMWVGGCGGVRVRVRVRVTGVWVTRVWVRVRVGVTGVWVIGFKRW